MADERDPEVLKLAEQIKRTQQAFAKIGAFDTWTMTVDIAGWLDGGIEDWPSHIQGGIYKAIEQQCKPKYGEHVRVVVAKCYKDAPDEPSYLAVVVQAFPSLTH